MEHYRPLFDTPEKLGHYNSMQSQEIAEHRYYLSEMVGYNVGDFVAIQSWIQDGHAERFRKWYMIIYKAVEKEISNSPTGELTIKQIHEVLGD